MQYFIPYGITGFVCFAYGDLICLKLGLYQRFSKYREFGEEGYDQLHLRERQNSEWEKDFVFDPKTGGVSAKIKGALGTNAS